MLNEAELVHECLNFTSLSTTSSSDLKTSSPALHRIANGWNINPDSGRSELTPEWAVVPPPSNREKLGNVALAIDCEMVDVAGGEKALARIAVVDFWSEELLMDELVKPDSEVVDYVTT